MNSRKVSIACQRYCIKIIDVNPLTKTSYYSHCRVLKVMEASQVLMDVTGCLESLALMEYMAAMGWMAWQGWMVFPVPPALLVYQAPMAAMVTRE